jgi:hypothetical protein
MKKLLLRGGIFMDPEYPNNTVKLLQVIQAEWSALKKVVKTLSLEQMVKPDAGGWSPKDNLSHISHWERFMLLHYLGNVSEADAKGIDAETLKGLDEDGENDILFKRNRNRSVEDVLKELDEVHEQVISTLKTTPFSRLLEPVPSRDAQQYSVLVFVIGNTSAHYAEHRATIEKVLKA